MRITIFSKHYTFSSRFLCSYARNLKKSMKISLPEKIESFKTYDAVGGHSSKKGKCLDILNYNCYILKPVNKEKEVAFYNELVSLKPEIIQAYQDHIPTFYGIKTFGTTAYIVLDNLTHGMPAPHVMDIKIGTQSYDDDAPEEKKRKHKAKFPLQEEIGVRMVGIKSPRLISSRIWSLSHTKESLKSSINDFFLNDEKLIEKVNSLIKEITTVFETKPLFKFYASSILFLFDEVCPLTSIKVKMIDFAHAQRLNPLEKVDKGYLTGLYFLQNCLKPSQCAVSNNILGGHVESIKSSGQSIIKLEKNKDSLTFTTELEFYKANKNLKFLPKFIQMITNNNGLRLLYIEDSRKLLKPNGNVSVIDLKLGFRSFTENCLNEPKKSYFLKYKEFIGSKSNEKIEVLWKKSCGLVPKCLENELLGKKDYLKFRDSSTTSNIYGIRLTCLINKTNNFSILQDESRNIETYEVFKQKLRFHFEKNNSFLIKMVIKQIKQVKKQLKTSKLLAKYILVGSSLLINHTQSKVIVKLIDFANAALKTDQDFKEDNGILVGIENSVKALSEI